MPVAVTSIERLVLSLKNVHSETLLSRCDEFLKGPIDVSGCDIDSLNVKVHAMRELHSDVCNGLRQIQTIATQNPTMALTARDGVVAHLQGSFIRQTAAFTLSNWVIPVLVELFTIVRLVRQFLQTCLLLKIGMKLTYASMQNIGATESKMHLRVQELEHVRMADELRVQNKSSLKT